MVRTSDVRGDGTAATGYRGGMTPGRDNSGAVGERPAQAIVDEFDSIAGWTADAARELGAEFALPAACRGSGSPAALDWLLAKMRVRRGTRLLDVGSGVGGPSGYAAQAVGAQPVLVDPMEGAIEGSGRLFGLPALVADGAALPFGDNAFDAVWSLGVLCTVTDKLAHLGEMVRVVPSGAPVGLLVYERTEDLRRQPDGNHFPTSAEVGDLVGSVGLEIIASALIAEFDPPPRRWVLAAEQVDLVVSQRHRHHPARKRAQEQQHVLSKLLEDRSVVGRLLVGRS